MIFQKKMWSKLPQIGYLILSRQKRRHFREKGELTYESPWRKYL